MIIAGLIVLLIGIALELMILLRGAWPSLLSWILMATGLVLLAVGISRRNTSSGKYIWGALGAIGLVGLIVWLTS